MDFLRENIKTAQEALGAIKKIDIFVMARIPDDVGVPLFTLTIKLIL
jgi:hypothetical protein